MNGSDGTRVKTVTTDSEIISHTPKTSRTLNHEAENIK